MFRFIYQILNILLFYKILRNFYKYCIQSDRFKCQQLYTQCFYIIWFHSKITLFKNIFYCLQFSAETCSMGNDYAKPPQVVNMVNKNVNVCQYMSIFFYPVTYLRWFYIASLKGYFRFEERCYDCWNMRSHCPYHTHC